MEEREVKIKEYLKKRKLIQEERARDYENTKQKKRKVKKDYALDEFPEREAVKKAAAFLIGKFKKKPERNGRSSSQKELLKSKNRFWRHFKKDKANGKFIWLDKGIAFFIYSALFFTPLFIIPATPNPLEFSKQLFLFVMVGSALLLWIWKMITEEKMEIKKSFLFIPITAFVLTYALSSIFSVYPEMSFWGYAESKEVSFSSLLVFALYFLILTNNVSSVKSIRKMLFLILLSGSIAAVYATLQFWGFHVLEIPKLENRLVNSIGNFSASAIYFVSMTILASGMSIFSSKKWLSFFYFIFTLTYLSFLASVFYKGIWILFVFFAGVVLAIGIAERRIRKKTSSIFLPALVFMFALLSLLIGKPILKAGIVPSEILLSPGKSLEIILKSVKENPFLGSGPGTFAYQYEIFKPNMDRFMAAGVNRPTNYVFLLAATTGMLNLVSFIFLIFILSRFTIANTASVFLGRNKKMDITITAVGIFWLFLTATSFFYLSNITLLFLWWVALAILDISRPVKSVFSAVFQDEKEESNTFVRMNIAKISLLTAVIFVAYAAFFTVAIYSSAKNYLAAYYYQRALDKNTDDINLTEVLKDIEKASKLDNGYDLYFRNLAVVYFASVKERINLAGQEFSGEDSKYISDNLTQAVTSAEKSIEINNYDFENHKNLGWVYQEMGKLDASYSEKSLAAYRKSLEFSRENPDIYYQIANLYLDLYNREVLNAQKQKAEPGAKSKEYLLSAEENLNKSLAINQFHFGANMLLPTILELLNKKEESFKKTEENWKTFWGNTQAGFSLAVRYYKKDDCDQALPILNLILSNYENYSNARYLTGFCLAKQGKLNESLDQFEKIRIHNSKNEILLKIISDLRKGKTDFLNQTQ
jgi:hypothetical protein